MFIHLVIHSCIHQTFLSTHLGRQGRDIELTLWWGKTEVERKFQCTGLCAGTGKVGRHSESLEEESRRLGALESVS